jgi:SpoIID/LytB domain protein
MRGVLGLLLTASLTLAAPATPAAAAGPAPSPTRAIERSAAAAVTVTGNGFGHGHGLSQWGAKTAAERGLSHRQILSFYYPRLERGSVGGTIAVLITGDTSGDLQVRDRPRLRLTSLGNGRTYDLGKRSARWWRITSADGGARSTLSYRANGSRQWRVLRTVPGEAQLDAGGRPLTLRTPTETRRYRGALRSAGPAGSSGERDTVNIVPLEDYLRGVVPREVPALWPQEAVRAQAVAARTYAAFERAASPAGRHYQVCDTSACQVYGGVTDAHPASDQAIRATSGDALLWRGEPAFTQFSASNGGHTSRGAFGYLPARKDPYDKAYRGWTTTVTDAEVRAALPAVGALRSIEVLRRDGKGAFGGRVTSIRVVGSQGSSTLTGDAFRSYFGLMSTLFEVG